MGEYARHNGHEVKIGTCEDMYYLRADQTQDVDYEWDAETLAVVRFRFPFPDEDAIKPGAFEDYSRGVKVPGWKFPETLSGSDGHGSVQFTSTQGYILSLPCPEQFPECEDGRGTDVLGVRVGRNGFSGGGAKIRQQALRGGVWVTLVECGSCGALHRLDTLEDAEPVIEAFRTEADRTEWRRLSSDWEAERNRWGDGPVNYGDEPVHTGKARDNLLEIAARIMAGYFVKVPA